ncbi:alpha/beta fold hydrolase [Streptomyces sp. NPDC004609]|uniref:alpha/beta fold hydrolase n=1 Tax=Streptomyces sp. NPDC004609 TaxID=3364704 RepID=UPI0036C0779F
MDNMSRTLHKARSDDGTVIAYERRGEGPSVVLVSGALCTAATEAPLASLLASRFTVFTYDRRGRGGSGDTAPYAVEREIEDLAVVIDEAGGSARVHGMSSGGVLALRASAAGLPITQLSLYEPPFDPAARSGTQPTPYGERLRDALAADKRGDALALFLGETGMPAEMLAGMRQSPVWAALEAVAHTLGYDHEVMGDRALPACLLHEVPMRTMVIDGGSSPSWMRESARLAADALPRGCHRTLTGQTHEVAPHVLAPVLEEFFTS